MLKKIFLSICAIVVIAYLSLWAWAVHWIDEDKNIVDFVSEDKNTTLELAKTVWQITPAINREKDAQRLLKMAEWSVYTDLINDNMLNENYNTISQYYKKHENKLNEPLKGKFILQKLIFMNRALLKIKDEEFEKEIANMIANYSFYGKDNLETRIEWLPEFVWFIFWHQNTIYNDDNMFRATLSKYGDYFNNDIQSMTKKYHSNSFDYFASYFHGSFQCYNYHIHTDDTDKSSLLKGDNLGKTFFQMILPNITTQNEKELDSFNELINKNSNYLIILPIMFMDKESECRKSAINFLSKMNEVSTVLGKETVISKSLKSDLFLQQVLN